MKVLIFNFEYPPLGGGGGVATKQLAEELASRHQVTVITTAYRGLPRYEVCAGVKVVRVPVIGRRSLPTASLISMLMYVPMAFLTALRLIMQERPDVINAQFVIPSGLPAAVLARIFRIPLVVSFIGGDVYDPTKGVSPHRHAVLRLFVRLIGNSAIACTAISEDTKMRAQSLHGVTCPISVTHLGLIPSEAVVATRDDFNLPAEPVQIAVTIGRLIPRKSYEVLLEAWRSVPTAHLVIIGDGPLKARLTALIQEAGMSDRIHVLGFVSEEAKQQLLRLSQLYVSAAEHEGFGIVFLEAMEAGLPIIAVNEGGQTDFLQPNENAVLVPPHNPPALAMAVNELLDNREKSRHMSEANRVKVKSFYLTQTARVFEDILTQAISTYARK